MKGKEEEAPPSKKAKVPGAASLEGDTKGSVPSGARREDTITI